MGERVQQYVPRTRPPVGGRQATASPPCLVSVAQGTGRARGEISRLPLADRILGEADEDPLAADLAAWQPPRLVAGQRNHLATLRAEVVRRAEAGEASQRTDRAKPLDEHDLGQQARERIGHGDGTELEVWQLRDLVRRDQDPLFGRAKVLGVAVFEAVAASLDCFMDRFDPELLRGTEEEGAVEPGGDDVLLKQRVLEDGGGRLLSVTRGERLTAKGAAVGDRPPRQEGGERDADADGGHEVEDDGRSRGGEQQQRLRRVVAAAAARGQVAGRRRRCGERGSRRGRVPSAAVGTEEAELEFNLKSAYDPACMTAERRSATDRRTTLSEAAVVVAARTPSRAAGLAGDH